jgi:hypothetical protein
LAGFLDTGGVHGKKTPVPASSLLGAGASITRGEGVPGLHRVGGGWTLPESGLSLKKVIATLLLGEGHITCLAISALLPLITSNDPSLSGRVSEPLKLPSLSTPSLCPNTMVDSDKTRVDMG